MSLCVSIRLVSDEVYTMRGCRFDIRLDQSMQLL